MDPNAVVILNRLCYASGNSEWGSSNPSKTTAIRRVDNFGAGFLRAGAKVVYAEAINSVSHQIRGLFTSSSNVNTIFMTHPSASLARDFYVSSSRTPAMRIHMDPPQRRQVLALDRWQPQPAGDAVAGVGPLSRSRDRSTREARRPPGLFNSGRRSATGHAEAPVPDVGGRPARGRGRTARGRPEGSMLRGLAD